MTTILEVQEEIRKVQGELEEVRKRLQEEVPEPERMHLWKKEELLMKEKEQLRQKELLLMQAGQSTALIQHATHWNLAPQQQTVHTTTTTPYSAFAPPPQSHSLLVGFSAQDTPTSSRRKESSAPEVPVPLVEIKEEVALQLLHEQAVKWKPWSRNASSWAFFTVNDNQPVQVEKPQVLRCILCRPEAVNLDVLAQRTRARKGVITYNKSNGTTAMRKHIESEHPEIAKTYESEIENHRSMPRPLGAKKTPSQRRPKPLPLQCTSPEPLPQPIPQSTDQ
ncbi:unnamed protein product [Sphagnum troendelagicum]|jgi:hypothetical protein|uniref:BED-type domain-containing protein n=3 Tax=Sphagnum TaxID=13804 RepID=A0ABP0UAR9_9BRYO|nr:hypothetical protein CY35_02G170100 [Sphagnum magellanicum]